MKIVLCVSTMETGGAERVAATLVNAWSARGHEVVLMPTFSLRHECFYPLRASTRLVYLADITGVLRGGRLIAYLQRLRALRQFFREVRPDVVVSFLPNVNIMVLLASIGINLRTVVCERTDPFEMAVSLPLSFLRAILYPLASQLVVQTEAVALKFRSLRRPIPMISVIGNPIPEEFAQIHDSFHRPDRGAKRLLAVGRLSEEKRFDRLIQAFAKIAPKHPEWILRIVGDGPERGELAALISNYRLGGRVELPGRQTDMLAEFNGADAFALTSRFEGFPNALLEAMASGLPCVATDCPSGPAEISEQGYSALLVPVDDIFALEQALDELLGNAAMRLSLGVLARRSVLRRFSLEQILERWIHVMKS